ncbi:protein N-lysine methyltransferase METTL21A-like isoform X2 [Anneissia japonica]|uniref:protein N-lysine methyltransferase METTL21A-like isoform X2 n=1 Tax=Anneissia japonica TaxID=1529436 RepID=UPI00142556E4|nr:protein N-lysine methyltransferase METTL21A-like isoform X2 [Anneissia japonica]
MALVVYKPGFLDAFHKQERRFKFMEKELIIKQAWEKHGVAAVVWDAAVVLSEYLESSVQAGELRLDGSKLLELGAGTGLVGMMAALLGAKVTLTDRLEVIDSLTVNVENNFRDGKTSITVKELEWGKNLEDFSEKYDFIIGADIVYIKESFTALLHTLSELSQPNTKVLLSCRIRYQKDLDFLKMLKSKFSVDEVHFDKTKCIHIYLAKKLFENT